MATVDTATELLILHDHSSWASSLPTSERADLPLGSRKQWQILKTMSSTYQYAIG
jgi:hypothetical protein